MKLQVVVATIAGGVVATMMFGTGAVAAAQPYPTASPSGVDATGDTTAFVEVDGRESAPSIAHPHRPPGGINESCTVEPAVELNTSAQFIAAVSDCAPATTPAPPDGVEQTTAARFATVVPGNDSVARYPPHATRLTTPLITDAHLTVFGVHPSTKVEAGGNETRLRIAPRGTVRALIDYRLTRAGSNSTVTTHGVDAVRVRLAGAVVAEQSPANQTPAIEYAALPTGPAQMVVEADIRLVHRTTAVDNGTEARVTVVTVRDSIPVAVSDVNPTTVDITQARYPTGDTAVTIKHPSARWVGITVTATNRTAAFRSSTATSALTSGQPVETTHVWSRWRFRAEENASWARLVTATAAETTRTTAVAPPVFVHALRTGPETTDDSRLHRSLRGTITPQRGPDGVPSIRLTTVDTAGHGQSRTTVRVPRSQQPTRVVVSGLVRGERRRIDLRDQPKTQLRQPVLSATVRSQRMATATIVIALRDPKTGEPIVVPEGVTAAAGSASEQARLTVDGEPVATGSDGRAVVPIDEYGSYRIAYQPGARPVTQSGPGYSATYETVTWHPLATASGWVALLAELLAWGLSGLGILYGGRHIGRLLQRGEHR